MSHLEDFVGRYHQKMDAKNRIVIPADWRETIKQRNPAQPFVLYAASDLDTNLMIYNQFIALYDVKGYQIIRGSINGNNCYRLKIDKQHRILLAEELAEFAFLKKDIILAASPDKSHMRIWDPKCYDQWNSMTKYHDYNKK